MNKYKPSVLEKKKKLPLKGKKSPTQPTKVTPTQNRSHSTTAPKGWITAKEAAAMIGIKASSYVAQLCRNGTLKGTKIELVPGIAAWFVDPKSVKEFLATEQTTGFPRGSVRGKAKKPKSKTPSV